jgi:beta-glucosidase-like glycosyl hydrolase
VKAAAAAGYIFGRELRAVGVDMDLAPVGVALTHGCQIGYMEHPAVVN